MDTGSWLFRIVNAYTRKSAQCPCFRRLNTRYPPINQDRSSGRRRRCAPPSSPPREPSDTVWHPVYSHSTHVYGTPGAREEGLSLSRNLSGDRVCRATCCGDDDVSARTDRTSTASLRHTAPEHRRARARAASCRGNSTPVDSRSTLTIPACLDLTYERSMVPER